MQPPAGAIQEVAQSRPLLLTVKSSLRKEAHFIVFVSENRRDLATLGVDGLDKMNKLSPNFLTCTWGV